MNRHGISLNPTHAEVVRLRELWRADDDRARARRAAKDAAYWRERALRAEARAAATEDTDAPTA